MREGVMAYSTIGNVEVDFYDRSEVIQKLHEAVMLESMAVDEGKNPFPRPAKPYKELVAPSQTPDEKAQSETAKKIAEAIALD
jgi:hypothetical protein